MFDTLEATIQWIDHNIADDGTLSPENHKILVEHVATNEFPLIIFLHNEDWVIALDEPGKKPFDCYWFISGMITRAEAQRCLLTMFEDHTNFRILKIFQTKRNLK